MDFNRKGKKMNITRKIELDRMAQHIATTCIEKQYIEKASEYAADHRLTDEEMEYIHRQKFFAAKHS